MKYNTAWATIKAVPNLKMGQKNTKNLCLGSKMHAFTLFSGVFQHTFR